MNGGDCVHTTPVEFNRTPDAVSSRAQNNYRFIIVMEFNIVFVSVVGQVQVIGLRRIFASQRINLFYRRQNVFAFTPIAHLLYIVVYVFI